MGARTGVPCLSGQVSGVSGPRGVLSAVCGGGGALALKFLFCEQSLAPPQLPSRLPAALPPSPFPSLFIHRTPSPDTLLLRHATAAAAAAAAVGG